MASTEVAQSFVEESNQISPVWLNGPNGQRFRLTMSVIWDALQNQIMDAVWARFPIDPNGAITGVVGGQLAPSDALPWMGADRQITQGYEEGSLSYAQRLVQYLDRWPYAGKPTGVMMAVIGWLLPSSYTIEIVTNSSRWFSYTAGTNPMPPGVQGAINVTPPTLVVGGTFTGEDGYWNWDDNAVAWWRSWLILYVPSSPWEGPTWGSGRLWGDPTISWGFSMPANIFNGVSLLVKQWKAAHEYVPTVIWSFDTSLFSSAQPDDGVHNPDGTFGRWSKINAQGQYVPARFANARYANGAV